MGTCLSTLYEVNAGQFGAVNVRVVIIPIPFNAIHFLNTS